MIPGITAGQVMPHHWSMQSSFAGGGDLGAINVTAPASLISALFVGSGRLQDVSSITQDYYASAVRFPGTAYLRRNAWLTGVGAFNKFIFSAWIKLSAPNLGMWAGTMTGADQFYQGTTDNGVTFWPSISFGNSYSDTFPNTPGMNSTTWQHLFITADISAADGTPANWIKHFFINGTEKTNTADDTDGADNSVAAGTDFYFGQDGFGNSFTGDVADVQFWLGSYLDFTIQANRELFILAGRPVNPLIAAQTLGAQTILFQGNVSNFSTNQGTGGTFTLTGSLTNSTSSPSPRVWTATRTFAGTGNLSCNATVV